MVDVRGEGVPDGVEERAHVREARDVANARAEGGGVGEEHDFIGVAPELLDGVPWCPLAAGAVTVAGSTNAPRCLLHPPHSGHRHSSPPLRLERQKREREDRERDSEDDKWKREREDRERG
jgi:hypothetical protein